MFVFAELRCLHRHQNLINFPCYIIVILIYSTHVDEESTMYQVLFQVLGDNRMKEANSAAPLRAGPSPRPWQHLMRWFPGTQ